MSISFTTFTLVPIQGDDTRFNEILDEFEARTAFKSNPGEMRGRIYMLRDFASPDEAFKTAFAPVLEEIDPEQDEHIGVYAPGQHD